MTEAASPFSAAETLETLIRSRLLPLDAYDAVARRVRSDLAQPAEDLPRHGGVLEPAAVLAPLVERPEGLSVLLTRRAEGLRRHAGQIAFPGGRMDPGEAPWDAALREAEEEIGLDRGFVRIAGLGDPYDTATGYSITPVVGFVSPGFSIRIHEGEVAEVFEAPFAYLMDPANHERRSRDFGEGRLRSFYAIEHGERLIWGVTAGILRMLYHRLFE